MHYFTFDSVPSSDYGVYVVSSNIFDSAEEDVESIEIPYSNNVVHLSRGSFKPFTIKTECVIYDTAHTNLDLFRNFLQSRGRACRYVDSINSNQFRIARFKRAFEVDETDYTNAAVFNLEFEAKPQRFLTSGEIEVSVAANSMSTITNPELFSSKPLIEVAQAGNFTVGGYSVIMIHDTPTPTIGGTYYIDCETMQCYSVSSMAGGGTVISNANGLIELPDGFPLLVPGANSINNGTTGAIKITPRWWKL